jgi:hypothetical protein
MLHIFGQVTLGKVSLINCFCYGWKVSIQICLYGISIPKGWRVKEEEFQSEECSGSIDKQVQDHINIS